MSQPRRRRRRGRKRGSGTGGSGSGAPQEPRRETVQQSSGPQSSSRRRRRRGRGGGRGRTSSPKSSEDLVRALPKQRPETLTAPPDGQKLEDLIGELQSTWGVPQYPQEFRITIRVAADRDRSRGESSGPRDQAPPQVDGVGTDAAATSDAPKREKAPSPQRLSQNGGERSDDARPKRKRRRRRRGGGGDKPSGPEAPPG